MRFLAFPAVLLWAGEIGSWCNWDEQNKSRQVRAKGSGVDPSGEQGREEEGRRKMKVIWEEGTGITDTRRWRRREGGKDEGRKVTRADGERETGWVGDGGEGRMERGALLISHFDLADDRRSQLVNMRESVCARVWGGRLSRPCSARWGQGSANHKQDHPLHHREFSHLSNVDYNQQIKNTRLG